MGRHPSTPPVALPLCAVGAVLALVSLVLELAGARRGLVVLPLGVALGLVFATNAMVASGRRQWDGRGD